MSYTVRKLAQISGISVRTLHWYDEIELLKPAYYGSNGYRYYEEEQLLHLQQILFFRELRFELNQIKQILEGNDFDKMAALSSHREILEDNIRKTKKLIKTIDKTIEHLKGVKKMKETEMFYGFSKENQAEYENQIIDRFGQPGKAAIDESLEKRKNWSKQDEENFRKEWEVICKELEYFIKNKFKSNSKEVQAIIHKHYLWLSKCWTPTKETYIGHAKLIKDSDLKKAYEVYHAKLPDFIAEGIEIYANQNLQG